MKLYRIFQNLVLLAAVASNVPSAYAQEEIALDEVRKQFAAVKAPVHTTDAVTTVNDESFQAADSDIEAANQKLLAAEAELLRELQANQPKAESAAAPAMAEPAAVAPVAEPVKASANLDRMPSAVSPKAPIVFEEREIPGADFASQQMHNDLLTQSKQVDVLKSQNADLTKKLAQSEAKYSQIKAEVDRLRNKLMLSETEVERLSKVLEERNRAGIAAARGQAAVAPAAPAAARVAPAERTQARTAPAKAQPAPVPDDVPVVTVSADKAYLRTGPGPQNSPLMAVSKGTRLVVETMQGEWYRVITPKGDRAWINRDVIFFNNRRGPDVSSGGTLRIRGLDSGGASGG